MDHTGYPRESLQDTGELLEIVNRHGYQDMGGTGAAIGRRRHGFDTKTFVGQYVEIGRAHV